jgi:hypothetical protein
VSSPSPTAARAPELDFALSAYSAGRLRVADPNRWTLAAETAVIDKKGSEADAQEGEITLYRRGVDPRSTLGDAKITPVEAIRGRPAYRVDADGSPMLLWEYADDSMALITSRADGPGRYALTPAEERQVAEAFRPGPRRPVRIAIGASYVPDGYRLVEATASSATFIPTPDAVVRLGKPDPGPNMPPIATITLHVGPASEVHGRPRDGVICPEGTGRMAYCFAFLGDSQVEEVRSRSAVDTVELGRMLKSGRFVPLSDPDHWMPLSQAFPASALIGGE